MALPPEPLEELLPRADAVVLAEVTRILVQDAQDPLPAGPLGATSLGGELARQVVELKVTKVLFGGLGQESVTAVKPAGDYTLVVGAAGPFLLEAGEPCTILGRYGPDSYVVEDLLERARMLGKR